MTCPRRRGICSRIRVQFVGRERRPERLACETEIDFDEDRSVSDRPQPRAGVKVDLAFSREIDEHARFDGYEGRGLTVIRAASPLRCDQPDPHRETDETGDVVEIQAIHELRAMRIHGSRAEAKPLRNLFA
jgi:hypothetical protein